MIGPHASNVASEIVLTAVDKRPYAKKYRYIRNIDDFSCYVRSREEGERFLCDLEVELREFDLFVNHKKTTVTALPVGHDKSWKHQLEDLPKIGRYGKTGYREVNAFIDIVLGMADEAGDRAIINCAMKKLSGVELSSYGKDAAAKRLMHIAILHPYLLGLMEEYVFKPYGVSGDAIGRFANSIFEEDIRHKDYESSCFAIYFAVRYGQTIDRFEKDYIKSQKQVIKSKDCLLLLMTWIYFMYRNHWGGAAKQLQLLRSHALSLKETDMERYWILL